MQDMIARLMQTNPALAYALMNNGLSAATPGYDPSSAYPVQGTPGMPQFSKPEPAVYRNGTPPAAAHNMPFVEGTPGMQAHNLPMPTDPALWEQIKKQVVKGVEGMKPKAAAATPPAGELPPKPPIPSYNIPGGVGSLGPSVDRIAALNAGGDVGVQGATAGAMAPGSAAPIPAPAPRPAPPPADPNAMSMAQKIGMMVGLGGGQAPGAPPIYQEMTTDPANGAAMVPGGLLGGPSMSPAVDIQPGQHSDRAENPFYGRRQPDNPGDAQRFRPMPSANTGNAKPMAPPQKPMFDPANNGKPMDVPLPPQRPDAAKPGPWGADPFKAAWADGVQGGGWGAPDDRYVGAFANATMPAQKGLLWPFSN